MMKSRSNSDSPAKPKPRSFFRILLSDITPRSTLMIPRKFTSEWGKDLGDHVFLKAPAGSVWEVALETTNGDVWLQNGWPQFATHYSLCFGHFLVFRYEGKSHFHVIILDNSAAEIDYPLNEEQPYHNRDSTDDHVGSQHRNGRFLMLNKKSKTISASHPGRQSELKNKKNAFTSQKPDSSEDLEETDDESNNSRDLEAYVESEDLEETDDSDNSRDLEAPVESDDSLSDGSDDSCKFSGKANKRLRQVTGEAEEARLLELVNGFKSKDPYFTVKMQPSYVSGKCFLAVPRNFIKKYISECHSDVILENGNGTTWAVKCNVFSNCSQFGVGWRKFAVANGLAVGDFCAFELSNCSKNLFKVTIFRAASQSV